MSDADKQKLASMLSDAPDLSAGLATSISSVQDQINELTSQAEALEGGLTDVAKASAIDIIENTILVDKGGDYVTYGATFGQIQWNPTGNLTDWEIIKLIVPTPPPILPAAPTVIYTYNEGDYPELDKLVEDYEFGNKYLTRPLTSGATYGLYPSIESYGDAKDILEANKDIIDDSIDKLGDYV